MTDRIKSFGKIDKSENTRVNSRPTTEGIPQMFKYAPPFERSFLLDGCSSSNQILDLICNAG